MSDSRFLIDNVRVIKPRCGMVGSSVLVEGDKVQAIDPPDVDEQVSRIDGEGRRLTPGLIDIHTHGLGHCLFESSPDALTQGLAQVARFGVTTILPTLYQVMDWQSLGKLAQLAQALEAVDAVRVPGFHLEGPFLALPGAGAATVPGDLALLAALIEACGSRLKAMSISPDTPGILPVIEQLVDRGIAPLITHTRADVSQTQAAIDAGAHHATHFYDVFHLPGDADAGVRPVGAVEAILADDRVSVDFIADGVHVDPTAIRMALRCKGVARTLLITDSNIGAGLSEGIYPTPWGFQVRVKPGDGARIHAPGSENHGRLAGSALTMNQGVAHLLNWLDVPEHDVWSMATLSVAQQLGLDQGSQGPAGLGDLRVGAPADLVLWDQDEQGQLTANRTWVAGQLVHSFSDATQAD